MAVLTFVIVVLRYGFDLGWIALQESVLYLHACVFMLGAAFTFKDNGHVRVDIFYRNFSARNRALVDACGALLLLAPFTIFMVYTSWDYVAASWQIRETSAEAGGLIYPFPSLLKTLIPAMACMLLLQALIMFLGAVIDRGNED